MQYRPKSAGALRMAVEVVHKKRLRERYLGDLIWVIAKTGKKNLAMMPFSDYDDLLDGKKTSAETEKERLTNRVEEMLNMYA